MHKVLVGSGLVAVIAGAALGGWLTAVDTSDPAPAVVRWAPLAVDDARSTASTRLDPEVLADPPRRASRSSNHGGVAGIDTTLAPQARAADALFARVDRGLESGLPAAEALELLAASAAYPDDWELQELAFRLAGRSDPPGHAARLLALACAETPVGQLVGALSSADALSASGQDALLTALATSQAAALDHGVAGLEAIQRRELAAGAVAERVRRLSFGACWEWLRVAQGTECALLILELDRQGSLERLSPADAQILAQRERACGLAAVD